MKNTTKTIASGSKAVVINQQEDRVWANLYVNARNGVQLADITLTRWEGQTIKGAEKWAKKVLAR